MSSKPILKIDWATHEAAKYACENWHYSEKVPVKLCFDKDVKKEIDKRIKPYPKRASSVESGTSVFQTERGGESPTDALQLRSEVVNG